MMTSEKRIWSIIFLGLCLQLAYTNMSPSNSDRLYPTGLIPNSPEQEKELHRRKIISVKPNQLALDRINSARLKKGQSPLSSNTAHSREKEFVVRDELTGVISGEQNGTAMTDGSLSSAELLSAVQGVDNSALVAFPRIRSQTVGSCIGWATTYYLMSHEICLTLGCDNKNLDQETMSPRWTYNMINGGVNNGSSSSNAFNLIRNHGAARWIEFPETGSNFTLWDLNAADWRRAVSRKMSPTVSMPINSDSGMSNVKTYLANGHVLMFGTYIYSWNYSSIKTPPGETTSQYLGQSVVTFQSGTSGGHGMTIVGYDDNIWVDHNLNGLAESQERGAFKVANSWGASWKNAGYIWVSYDAFRLTTTVPGFAPAGRNQLTQTGNAVGTNYVPYSPKFVAKITMSHAKRNQIAISLASSANSTLSPSSYASLFGFFSLSGAWSFNGTTTEVPATFYFDVSSLGSDPNQILYYLFGSDNLSLSPFSITEFSIENYQTGAIIFSSADTPKLIDGQSNQRMIAGISNIDTSAPSTPTNLVYNISSAKRGKRVSTVINLSWAFSSDNVGVSSYRVYRNGVLLGSTNNLNYSDSNTSAGQLYKYEVSALDSAGNESAKSSPLLVQR